MNRSLRVIVPLSISCLFALGCGGEEESKKSETKTSEQKSSTVVGKTNADPLARERAQIFEYDAKLKEKPYLKDFLTEFKTDGKNAPASDPLGVALNARAAAQQLAGPKSLEYNLNIMKNASPNGTVSFAEFEKLYGQLGKNMPKFPPYQYLLYDPKTVSIKVANDPVLHAELLKKAGQPVPKELKEQVESITANAM